MGGKVTAGLM